MSFRAYIAYYISTKFRSRSDRYVDKRTGDGKSRREIERILVRYIAREVYRALMHPMDAGRSAYEEAARSARSERLRAGATQSQAASSLGVASARISELERCVLVDEALLQRYRKWLNALSPERRREIPEKGLDSK